MNARCLNKEDKKRIVEAIREAERMTSGEIRVHLCSRSREDVLGEARCVFQRLGMQCTRERNGVLIFVALKSKRFAILGDRGIYERVGDDFWHQTKDLMQKDFSQGRIKEGIIAGIFSAGKKLKRHFPFKPDDRNELADKVTGS